MKLYEKSVKILITPYELAKIKLKNYKEKERKKINKKGINPELKIYIIKRKHKSGFFSNFFFVLGHIIKAEKEGYKIAVDMENYPTLYNEEKKIKNTMNAWEYYFKQPEDIDLKEAYRYKNITISSDKYLFEYVPHYMNDSKNIPDKQMVNQLSSYLDKYIKIDEYIIEEVNNIRNKWWRNILGVHIRGTDMNSAPGHPVPADLNTYFECIDECISQNKIHSIFICTDEVEILNKLKDRYGDLIISTEAQRSSDGRAVHTNENVDRENHKYNMGKEVLIDALLLSKCQHIICGHSNVAYAAILFNKNKYESCIIIE